MMTIDQQRVYTRHVTATSPVPLTYGRHNRLRRRVGYLVGVLVIVNLAALVYSPAMVGIQTARNYTSGYFQRRSAEADCTRYAAPSGSLLVNDGPLLAANAMVTRDSSGQMGLMDRNTADNPAQAEARRNAIFSLTPESVPTCWTNFSNSVDLYNAVAASHRVRCMSCLRQRPSFFGPTRLNPVVLFLHGRRSPGGPVRLVCVTFNVGQFEWGVLPPFYVGVFADGGFRRSLLCWSDQVQVAGLRHGSKALKLYAGRIDPTDESHFTIDCSLGTTSRVLDGWLARGDQVEISLRLTSATEASDGHATK